MGFDLNLGWKRHILTLDGCRRISSITKKNKLEPLGINFWRLIFVKKYLYIFFTSMRIVLKTRRQKIKTKIEIGKHKPTLEYLTFGLEKLKLTFACGENRKEIRSLFIHKSSDTTNYKVIISVISFRNEPLVILVHFFRPSLI